MNKKIARYYQHARAHQFATFGNSGLHINGVDQRQFTGGGAAYGEHAFDKSLYLVLDVTRYICIMVYINNAATEKNEMSNYFQESHKPTAKETAVLVRIAKEAQIQKRMAQLAAEKTSPKKS